MQIQGRLVFRSTPSPHPLPPFHKTGYEFLGMGSFSSLRHRREEFQLQPALKCFLKYYPYSSIFTKDLYKEREYMHDALN